MACGEPRMGKSEKESGKLKKGDVVKVKGYGNPLMTVEQLTGKSIGCVWFVESTLHRDSFPEDILELINRR